MATNGNGTHHEGTSRKLALVTGASRGIGFELARLAAGGGHDLIIAAREEEELQDAARSLREMGVTVETVSGDLAEIPAVEKVVAALNGRSVDVLMANAGHGLGGAFLDREFDQLRHMIDTNVTGTVCLIHHVGRMMRSQGYGRILITGSIAGVMPAPFHAVYHASKAFIDNFAAAIRNELADDGVSVTCLMPGATDTAFFAEADLLDAKVTDRATADPADVAKVGYEALMNGEGEVVHGMMNKMVVSTAGMRSSEALAAQNRKDNEPGSRS